MAPQVAVVDLARPRVVRPVLRVGEHGVDVREVAQHRPGLIAGQRGDEVRPLRLGAVELALQAGVGQVVAQPLLAGALVPGRVDGVELDELGQDLGGLLLQRVGHGE
jgi:hypothetical protein